MKDISIIQRIKLILKDFINVTKCLKVIIISLFLDEKLYETLFKNLVKSLTAHGHRFLSIETSLSSMLGYD